MARRRHVTCEPRRHLFRRREARWSDVGAFTNGALEQCSFQIQAFLVLSTLFIHLLLRFLPVNSLSVHVYIYFFCCCFEFPRGFLLHVELDIDIPLSARSVARIVGSSWSWEVFRVCVCHALRPSEDSSEIMGTCHRLIFSSPKLISLSFCCLHHRQLLGVWYEKGNVLVFVDTQQKCDTLFQVRRPSMCVVGN